MTDAVIPTPAEVGYFIDSIYCGDDCLVQDVLSLHNVDSLSNGLEIAGATDAGIPSEKAAVALGDLNGEQAFVDYDRRLCELTLIVSIARRLNDDSWSETETWGRPEKVKEARGRQRELLAASALFEVGVISGLTGESLAVTALQEAIRTGKSQQWVGGWVGSSAVDGDTLQRYEHDTSTISRAVAVRLFAIIVGNEQYAPKEVVEAFQAIRNISDVVIGLSALEVEQDLYVEARKAVADYSCFSSIEELEIHLVSEHFAIEKQATARVILGLAKLSILKHLRGVEEALGRHSPDIWRFVSSNISKYSGAQDRLREETEGDVMLLTDAIRDLVVEASRRRPQPQ